LAAFLVVSSLIEWRGRLPAFRPRLSIVTLEGPGTALGFGLGILTVVIMGSLSVFFIFFLLRVALRKDWLAAAAVVALALALSNTGGDVVEIIGTSATIVIAIVVLLRFGVLAVVVAAAAIALLQNFPITLDFSAWYAPTGLIGLGAILVLAIWSFRAALGGRKLFKEDLLER
jgi:hypothetical protein